MEENMFWVGGSLGKEKRGRQEKERWGRGEEGRKKGRLGRQGMRTDFSLEVRARFTLIE